MNFSVIILNSGFRIPVSAFRIPVSGFRLLGLPAKGEGANINCSKNEDLFKQKNQFHDDKIRYREAMNMIVLKGKLNRTQKATFSYSLSQMRIALKRYKRS